MARNRAFQAISNFKVSITEEIEIPSHKEYFVSTVRKKEKLIWAIS
jgi:hypothetical protein